MRAVAVMAATGHAMVSHRTQKHSNERNRLSNVQRPVSPTAKTKHFHLEKCRDRTRLRKKSRGGKIHRAHAHAVGMGRAVGSGCNYRPVAVLHGATLRKRVGAFAQLGAKKSTVYRCKHCQGEFAVCGVGDEAASHAWQRWRTTHPYCGRTRAVHARACHRAHPRCPCARATSP